MYFSKTISHRNLIVKEALFSQKTIAYFKHEIHYYLFFFSVQLFLIWFKKMSNFCRKRL